MILKYLIICPLMFLAGFVGSNLGARLSLLISDDILKIIIGRN